MVLASPPPSRSPSTTTAGIPARDRMQPADNPARPPPRITVAFVPFMVSSRYEDGDLGPVRDLPAHAADEQRMEPLSPRADDDHLSARFPRRLKDLVRGVAFARHGFNAGHSLVPQHLRVIFQDRLRLPVERRLVFRSLQLFLQRGQL